MSRVLNREEVKMKPKKPKRAEWYVEKKYWVKDRRDYALLHTLLEQCYQWFNGKYPMGAPGLHKITKADVKGKDWGKLK